MLIQCLIYAYILLISSHFRMKEAYHHPLTIGVNYYKLTITTISWIFAFSDQDEDDLDHKLLILKKEGI